MLNLEMVKGTGQPFCLICRRMNLSDKMLNIARSSCVLSCSTLYSASCTVEVSRLILSVLGCTLVTRSTKPSHVPLIFRQLSDTLISDRTTERRRRSIQTQSLSGRDEGSGVVFFLKRLSTRSGFIGHTPVASNELKWSPS
jgi:hypothetical protein